MACFILVSFYVVRSRCVGRVIVHYPCEEKIQERTIAGGELYEENRNAEYDEGYICCLVWSSLVTNQ